MIDADTLRFFDGHEGALPLYEAFEERLYERYPETANGFRRPRSLSSTGMSSPASRSHGY